MNTKSFLVCFIVLMAATSIAWPGRVMEISPAVSLAAEPAHSTAAIGIIIATMVTLVSFS